MRVRALGDELAWSDSTVPRDTVLLIYEYHRAEYEGEGQACAITGDGHVWFKNLAHCSCFGPLDVGENNYDGSPWNDTGVQVGEWLLRDPETGVMRTSEDCDAKFVEAVRVMNG